MKKSILILASFLMILSSCIKTSGTNGKNGEDGISFNWNGNEGKGPIKEKTTTENFTGVEVSNALKVEIYKSTENKVVISAPDDILEFIVANVQSDGTMKIGIKSNTSWNKGISTKNVKVKVYTKLLNKIEANSSAEIKVKDKFTQDNIEVKVSSSGEVEGNLEANNFEMSVNSSGDFDGEIWADVADISVSSSGSAKLKGKIQNATISVSSSGDFEGENLEIKKGNLQASSSGDLQAMVSGNVEAKASSSGSIRLKKIGNPSITKTESSSGSVSVSE